MDLELIKIGFTVPFFLYAAYSDYKTRKVSDKLWLPLIGLALFFMLLEFSLDYFYKVLLSIGIIFPLSFLLMYFNFGGADAKFLMVVALLFPRYPLFFDPIYLQGWIFSLTVFLNALILTLVYPVMILVINIKRGDWANPLRMIVALKKPADEISNDDKIVEDSVFSGKGIDDFEDKDYYWISPKIPFIVSLVAGYFVSVFYGDIWLSFIL